MYHPETLWTKIIWNDYDVRIVGAKSDQTIRKKVGFVFANWGFYNLEKAIDYKNEPLDLIWKDLRLCFNRQVC